MLGAEGRALMWDVGVRYLTYAEIIAVVVGRQASVLALMLVLTCGILFDDKYI